MEIQEIYRKYKIPPNLQLHMYRVAAVGALICDNWKGKILDRNKIIRVLLLHDTGNIVKGNYDKNPEILGEEIKNKAYWIRIQKEYINKYGTDDHYISEMIGREVGLSEEEIKLMNSKIFINNQQIVKSNDYELKICAYADQRVSPNGVESLLSRLLEAKDRYKNIPNSSMNNPKTNLLIELAVEIEKQIMKFCILHPKEITNDSIKPYLEKLKKFKI